MATATVKISTDAQKVLKRYASEKGVTQKEAAQYLFDLGASRKNTLFIAHDKKAAGRPASAGTKKSAKKSNGLTASQIKTAKAFKAEGFSNADIATEMKISKAQVAKALNS